MALRSSLGFLRLLPRCQNVAGRIVTQASAINFSVTRSMSIFNTSSTKGIQDISVITPWLSRAPVRNYSILQKVAEWKPALLTPREPTVLQETRRNLVKFGYRGKRKTVKAVLKRFYRLNWGIWIRPRSGRHRKLWRKGGLQKLRARTHVFCNATQSFMLDKMVGKYWIRRKYWVDDPYEPYHSRPEFWITKRRG